MAREINLDGGEITVLKAMGTGGGETTGEDLLLKAPNMGAVEMAGVLKDLMMLGYVNSDRSSFYNDEEFKKTSFQVNPGYAKDIRDALDPDDPKPKSRRVRRE